MEYEPNYENEQALYIDRTNEYHEYRIRHLASLCAEWGISPASVLDYGGEEDAWLARGAFPNTRVKSYDISNAEENCVEETFDLVICAHVLEHVPYPIQVVRDVSKYVAPQGYLYIEVPAGNTEPTMVEGHPLNRMHEHVTYFSANSLCRLLEASGVTPRRLSCFITPYFKACAVLASHGNHVERYRDVNVEQDDYMESWMLRPDMQRIHRRAQLWRQEHIRIVVHPAGQYAMELLAYTALRDAGVVALSDNDVCLHSKILLGLPVIPPSSIPGLGVDIVLVASPTYSDEIAAELKWLEQFQIKVIRHSEV